MLRRELDRARHTRCSHQSLRLNSPHITECRIQQDPTTEKQPMETREFLAVRSCDPKGSREEDTSRGPTFFPQEKNYKRTQDWNCNRGSLLQSKTCWTCGVVICRGASCCFVAIPLDCCTIPVCTIPGAQFFLACQIVCSFLFFFCLVSYPFFSALVCRSW